MMIFLWIILIIVVFYILGDHEKHNNKQNQETSAEDVLKMRYVKGEINDETFEKMKKIIF